MESVKMDTATETVSVISPNSVTEEDATVEEGKSFKRLPHKKPVDIRFDNLGYTVSLGFRKGTKKILYEVCGRFPHSQLIAIMGPSGAGKSTLLDILSGYRITGVTGSVLVDGIQRDLDEFRRMSCYITQDDRLQPLLTVSENMRVAADFKLGENVPRADKNAIIEEILGTLGLDGTKNTRAGRLSGGQKKRLSIALELIANPLVMFLDEPTTGLDSSSCTQCVSLLKVLARQGRTIVCTIHQPSASLFQMFDQVYVLSQGECVYQGSTEKLVPYLSSVQLPCPMYHNPADYVIELACGDYGEDKIDIMVRGTENGRSIQWFGNPEALAYVKPARTKREEDKNPKFHRSLQETSIMNQLKVLLQRGFIKSKRDSTLTHMRIAVNILTGVMLGVLFIQAGDEGSRVLDNYNLLFGILMHHMMTTMMLTILTSFVWTVALYGSEPRTPGKAERKAMEAFEMWDYRRMLIVRWEDGVTNEEVLQHVGEKRSLWQNLVKRRDSSNGNEHSAERALQPLVLVEVVLCSHHDSGHSCIGGWLYPVLCNRILHELSACRRHSLQYVRGHQYDGCLRSAELWPYGGSLVQRREWYVPWTNAVCAYDDVRRFWCKSQGSSRLPKMGQLHQLFALWTGRICGCNLWTIKTDSSMSSR